MSEDVAREETAVARDAKSDDVSPSQSVQNEHDNINSEEMVSSASFTTNDSAGTSNTIPFEHRQLSGAFGYDVCTRHIVNIFTVIQTWTCFCTSTKSDSLYF